MTINNLTQKELNKLNIYATCIVNDEDYAKDIVQDFLLKMLEKGKGDMEFNCGYSFKGLKLLFLEQIYIDNAEFRKLFPNEYQHFKEMENITTEEDLMVIKEEDIEFQTKLNSITNTYEELDTFDQQLYYVHYIQGMSQREISRQTEIKLGVIKYRFKLIKEKIQNNYEKNNK
jgi:RNA polymerase sigma factor (sigma-70 family)